MLSLLACVLGVFPAYDVYADTSAPVASSTAISPASTTKAPPSANLGKINVNATRELIKTMQVVKVALNAPFSGSRDQADVVVCRIITGHGHLNVEQRMGAVLECGTNSWFTWRSEKCKNAVDTAACAADVASAPYKRKGAWHSRRALDFKQLAALRQLLGELPAPGKGDVVVVDKNGKTTMAIKAGKESSGNDQP